MPGAARLAAQLAQEVVGKSYDLCRFLEEEAEELSRLHREHAAEAKAKREQQVERERMVCPCLTGQLDFAHFATLCRADAS